ncbi:Copper binding periplasmic protein CusF [Bernardetia litoralis DSM 6794]|uniref:Copper binding periplasmic protein CusF n=1 Tax=Bernardetia litoralis (strain ATCC 23117 / DSM 6794 / NBRC 15988 / NCIMB 1366 / Fx l1 / Sio-4) TaxID=880071 RepID=I4APK5_BERLS|nr:copper-binding protein [Bernardetia litoralis]AFM05890.1 Copper binding periplasmic protein CusF [Bernardetia litoralis DSM 6794]
MKKIALVAFAATFMFACQPKSSETTEETVDSTAITAEETPVEEEVVAEETPEEVFYTVRGQIVEIGEADEEGNAMVTLHHEEIPDVMMAMKMDLKTNTEFLGEVAADDKISFEMLKTEEGYMMRNIEKLPAETELTLKK